MLMLTQFLLAYTCACAYAYAYAYALVKNQVLLLKTILDVQRFDAKRATRH